MNELLEGILVGAVLLLLLAGITAGAWLFGSNAMDHHYLAALAGLAATLLCLWIWRLLTHDPERDEDDQDNQD